MEWVDRTPTPPSIFRGPPRIRRRAARRAALQLLFGRWDDPENRGTLHQDWGVYTTKPVKNILYVEKISVATVRSEITVRRDRTDFGPDQTGHAVCGLWTTDRGSDGFRPGLLEFPNMGSPWAYVSHLGDERKHDGKAEESRSPLPDLTPDQRKNHLDMLPFDRVPGSLVEWWRTRVHVTARAKMIARSTRLDTHPRHFTANSSFSTPTMPAPFSSHVQQHPLPALYLLNHFLPQTSTFSKVNE